MDYVTMGRSGLKVSPVCLGAMTFGISDFSSVDEAQARRIIDAFLDSGHCFEETMRRWTASCARQAPYLGCSNFSVSQIVEAQ
jgi:predicted aldo/keto reductase-like oxidoreductase